jgi:hypothetical protein
VAEIRGMIEGAAEDVSAANVRLWEDCVEKLSRPRW